MVNLIYIVLGTLAAGVGSVLVAALCARALLSAYTQHLLSLAAGALLATAFMHLLPEAFESGASPHQLFITLLVGLVFFFLLFAIIYFCLVYIKNAFAPDAIPWADALASASALTGMWLMTRKKVESWIWWIITNIASMPLYYVKGFAPTSLYYFILLVLAIFGLKEWKNKANAQLV